MGDCKLRPDKAYPGRNTIFNVVIRDQIASHKWFKELISTKILS